MECEIGLLDLLSYINNDIISFLSSVTYHALSKGYDIVPPLKRDKLVNRTN